MVLGQGCVERVVCMCEGGVCAVCGCVYVSRGRGCCVWLCVVVSRGRGYCVWLCMCLPPCPPPATLSLSPDCPPAPLQPLSHLIPAPSLPPLCLPTLLPPALLPPVLSSARPSTLVPVLRGPCGYIPLGGFITLDASESFDPDDPYRWGGKGRGGEGRLGRVV